MPQGEKGEVLDFRTAGDGGLLEKAGGETEMPSCKRRLAQHRRCRLRRRGRLRIFLVDRIKDLILCSGYNVYPRVIEEAIYLHPAVAETIVIADTQISLSRPGAEGLRQAQGRR